MNNHFDWTEIWDQEMLAKKANFLVDDILKQIFHEKLEFHNKLNLDLFELSLLYRWLLHVGVNTFIERLIRVLTKHNKGLKNSYPLSERITPYFNNTTNAVQAYYYDFSINYKLLNDISEVIAGSTISHLPSAFVIAKPQESLSQQKHYGLKKVFRYIFLQSEYTLIRIIKPKIVGEYSHWFRKHFFFGNSIDFYNQKIFSANKQINPDTREDFKNIFNKIFINNISIILEELSDHQIRQLAKLFGDWIDHILPLSVVEGLNIRFEFYKKLITGWRIEQLHTFTGYWYNDNFKVLAILARRKGAKYIGHTHGNNNYVETHYKFSNILRFVDYYTTYGIRVTDDLLNNPGSKNVKLVPIGSVSFHALKKWNKSELSFKNFTLLYPSGPLRDFMPDLQEISPEKRLYHRLQVLGFIELLLKKYSGLRVLYKPFPGTFTNDPIKEKCAKWFDEGRIELTEKHPGDLYHSVDFVLWDSISTGFVESIVARVPVIVFNSAHEYEQTTPCGKLVNDALTEAGVQCFDINNAIWSFERIMNDLDRYKKDTAQSIKLIMKDMGTPVSRKEWHRRFRQGLPAEDI